MKYAEKVLQMGGDIRCGHRVIQTKQSVSGAGVRSQACSLAIGASIADRYIGMVK